MNLKKRSEIEKMVFKVWVLCSLLFASFVCMCPVKAKADMIKYFTQSDVIQRVYTPNDISCGDGYTIKKGTLVGKMTLSHIYAYVSEHSHYNYYSKTESAEVWTYCIEPYVIMQPQKIKAEKIGKNGATKEKEFFVANSYTMFHLPLADYGGGTKHDCFVADWVPRDINTLDFSKEEKNKLSVTISNDGKKYIGNFTNALGDSSIGLDGLKGSLEFISDFVTFQDDTNVEKRDFKFTYYFNKSNWLGICSSDRAKRVYADCATEAAFKWYSRNQKYICLGTEFEPASRQFFYTGRFDIVDKKTNPKTIWEGIVMGKIDFSNK